MFFALNQPISNSNFPRREEQTKYQRKKIKWHNKTKAILTLSIYYFHIFTGSRADSSFVILSEKYDVENHLYRPRKGCPHCFVVDYSWRLLMRKKKYKLVNTLYSPNRAYILSTREKEKDTHIHTYIHTLDKNRHTHTNKLMRKRIFIQ